MNASQFDTSQLKGLGIKPLASLKAHWRLSFIIVTALLFMAAPVVWFKGAPVYVTSATVQVAPRYMKNIKDDNELDFQSNSQYRQFVEHQVRSVARYDIVERAIKTVTTATLSGVRPIDRYKDEKTNTYYVLTKLNLEEMKNNLEQAKELNAQVRDFVRKNADKMFDRLEKEEDKRLGR